MLAEHQDARATLDAITSIGLPGFTTDTAQQTEVSQAGVSQ
jgi:hypothetical protein